MSLKPAPGYLYQTLPTEELERVKAEYNAAYQDTFWKDFFPKFKALKCNVGFMFEYADGSSKTFIVTQDEAVPL